MITGYRAVVDPRALGYALSAVIRVRPAPGQLANVAEAATATPAGTPDVTAPPPPPPSSAPPAV